MDTHKKVSIFKPDDITKTYNQIEDDILYKTNLINLNNYSIEKIGMDNIEIRSNISDSFSDNQVSLI